MPIHCRPDSELHAGAGEERVDFAPAAGRQGLLQHTLLQSHTALQTHAALPACRRVRSEGGRPGPASLTRTRLAGRGGRRAAPAAPARLIPRPAGPLGAPEVPPPPARRR